MCLLPEPFSDLRDRDYLDLGFCQSIEAYPRPKFASVPIRRAPQVIERVRIQLDKAKVLRAVAVIPGKVDEPERRRIGIISYMREQFVTQDIIQKLIAVYRGSGVQGFVSGAWGLSVEDPKSDDPYHEKGYGWHLYPYEIEIWICWSNMWSHDASATALRQCTNILNPYLYGHSTPQIYHVDFSVASEFLSAASVIDALPTTNFIESHLLSTPLTEIWTYNFGAEISQQDEDRMRMMKKDLGVTIGHVVEKQNMGRREWYTRKDIMDCLVVMVREGGKWDKIDDRWGLDFVDKTISCVEFASF